MRLGRPDNEHARTTNTMWMRPGTFLGYSSDCIIEACNFQSGGELGNVHFETGGQKYFPIVLTRVIANVDSDLENDFQYCWNLQTGLTTIGLREYTQPHQKVT